MLDNSTGGKFVSTVPIDAYRLPLEGEDVDDSFFDWCEKVGLKNYESGRDSTLVIQMGGKTYTAEPGTWIVKNASGTFFVVPHDMMEAAYKPAENPADTLAGNVQFLLDQCPMTEKEVDSKGEPIMIATLARTFLRLQRRVQELEALVGASAP